MNQILAEHMADDLGLFPASVECRSDHCDNSPTGLHLFRKPFRLE
jgi:hypothetical protein